MSIKLTMLAVAALLAATPALATKLPADLAKAAADYDQAQIDGNRAELERLLADDYVLVNSHAEVSDKAGLIHDNTAPGFKLDPYVVREPVERVWANGAVLGGIVSVSGVDGGKPFKATFRFADVWARRKGVWQVIYTEVTRPPAS
ncbi:MAG TPA: nuclear transport factor 2 family protein [Aliidongia sp.]|uniref:nuclear transport factor 2 family protein n=1 Tax=Aliidongia sp. TaxID=1914230 RepID=UPI002DDCD225|nr:nuclear transport factor 2 family protein [Aliidongia sp.]HEV2675198.1 nuclear transport factor 2 family protein [Aliidongia sp.]